MAAAAQKAAAAEAAANNFDLCIIDGRGRCLEVRDICRRDAAMRRSRRHLSRRFLTRAAIFGPKARKHDKTSGKGLGKVGGFLFWEGFSTA